MPKKTLQDALAEIAELRQGLQDLKAQVATLSALLRMLDRKGQDPYPQAPQRPYETPLYPSFRWSSDVMPEQRELRPTKPCG